MSKLYSGREIIKALQKDNFILVSQKGSHVKLVKEAHNQKFTVIVPNHREVAIGTFSSILRQAGKTRIEFEKLLK